MSDDAFGALFELVCEHFEVNTHMEVAKVLGAGQPQVTNWLNRRGPTKKRWKRLLEKLVEQAARELVWPLFEFESVVPVRHGKGWRIDADATTRERLKATLANHVGVYTFYDSAGRSLYVGKTTNNLWTEIHQRLDADVNRAMYFPKRAHGIVMGNLTRRVSAYAVGVPGAVHNVEALLIRISPNDQANTQSADFKFSELLARAVADGSHPVSGRAA